MSGFYVQRTLERLPWEVDVGVALNFKRWGFGLIADYFGSSAPNGIVLQLGPLFLWLTIWYWITTTTVEAE